ncbi:MAG: hypothetical protein B6D41_01265 [Chloroflexi bacterium UTCFX4]|nr:MAG: hypothetical protein B6D41_01265 [Chloroflexi bacterium UTCFX4]
MSRMSRQKKSSVRQILFSTLFSLPQVQSNDDIKKSWQKLSDREKQVARLAAQRMKDAEIAQQLVLSQKTVGHHLSSVFRKLDIDSRHELKYVVQLVDDSPLRPK